MFLGILFPFPGIRIFLNLRKPRENGSSFWKERMLQRMGNQPLEFVLHPGNTPTGYSGAVHNVAKYRCKHVFSLAGLRSEQKDVPGKRKRVLFAKRQTWSWFSLFGWWPRQTKRTPPHLVASPKVKHQPTRAFSRPLELTAGMCECVRQTIGLVVLPRLVFSV